MNTTLVLLVGGGDAGPVGQVVRAACQAAARDLLEATLEAGVVDRAVIATDDTAWTAGLEHLPVEIDPDPPGAPFHFGQRLADLIRRFDIRRALYAGGGSAPLMRPADWQQALAGFEQEIAVTNNLHSCDWIAFPCTPEWMTVTAAQERDNSLAWQWAQQTGLAVVALPPSAASRFDLDTPSDLSIARFHPRLGAHLRAALQELPWPVDVVEGVLNVMASEGGRMAIIGRSSAAAWQALEEATHCEMRLFVEERGMVASGRLKQGQVRSLLADLVERTGVEGFFGRLASLVDAALFDSRVLIAAQGLWPPQADRFNADLFRWQEVETAFLRQFSRAAAQTGIPILLGGQSVVNGGLMALVETLQARRQ